MELGETISQLRKEKNISIKDLCSDRLSRSAYTRFINNETDTSSTNFLFFLDRLQVSLNEFMFVKNDYKLSENERYMIKLQIFYLDENLLELEKIEKDCAFLSKSINDTFKHLSLLSNIYQSRIKNKPIDINIIEHLKNYLINVDTWTHYEIILFNNSMFIYNIEFIELILRRATSGLDRYHPIRSYTSESFAMLSNVLNIYLSSKELHKANKLFKNMISKELPEDLVRERLHLAFYDALITLILHKDSSGHIKIQQVLNICDFLNMDNSYKGYSKLYVFLCNLYNL
ncbi:TPA: hypothetical protein ACGBG5_003582 [Enterococcus faecalis]